MASKTQSIWTRILDLIAPRLCACCGQRLTVSEQIVCASCILHFPRTYFHEEAQDNPMAKRFWGRLPIERATAYFYYAPGSSTSRPIRMLKYENRPDIGEALGRMAAEEAMGSGVFKDIDLIIPMPLTRWRKWQRGYNQSTEIARGISEVTGIPICTTAVRRTAFKQSQTQLHYAERQRNVEGSFVLRDPEAVKGRHLLLVDDIVTSGATMTACGKILAEAGGVRFSVMSLGYTKS